MNNDDKFKAALELLKNAPKFKDESEQSIVFRELSDEYEKENLDYIQKP